MLPDSAYRPDVFLLGAGFSKAISPEMPTLAELSERLRDRVRGEVRFPDYGALSWDFELLLTYLSQSYPWQDPASATRERSDFLYVQDRIADEVRRAMRRAPSRKFPGWLIDLVTRWDRETSPVITLNYDTCVERAFERAAGERARGGLACYPVPIADAIQRLSPAAQAPAQVAFQLLKLHGSVSWYYAGPEGPANDQVYALLEHRGDDEGFGVMLNALSDRVPLIVPPVNDKSAFCSNLTMRAIWRTAAWVLNHAKRVFCLGYSLPITDLPMRYLLISNAPARKVRFHLVNLAQDDEAKRKLKAHYSEALMVPDPSKDRGWGGYVIDDTFVLPEDPIPSFVRAYIDGDLDDPD